ncbi:hypothetical protein PENSPDRAFT_652357 [Peniophora sp. CONT]|nr:hypothetical protein PENSPDRAFT_652357 [Peniophora sp. CONT]
MAPYKGRMPTRKTVRCKFFSDEGNVIYGGCERASSDCNFVHPDESEWADAEKRLNPLVEMNSRGGAGRRYGNFRPGRSRSRSRSPVSRSPSPGPRSRLPGPSSRRRSPSPRRRHRSRSPPRSPQRYRERGYSGHQSPTRSARASSPSRSARASSPPTPRPRPAQAQAGPSRTPMSPPRTPSSAQPPPPRERTTSRGDAMAVDVPPITPTAPNALRPLHPSRPFAEMMPPPPPPGSSSMPPPPMQFALPPDFPPFAPNLFKVPQPPPAPMVGGREMTDVEKVAVWNTRIALAADALTLRRECNDILLDIQQAEALALSGGPNSAAAKAATRLSQKKSQKDAELLKKIDALNREHFWPIAREVDVDKLQADHEELGQKFEALQAKLVKLVELRQDLMQSEARMRGVEPEQIGKPRKRRRVGPKDGEDEEGEVESDDEETVQQKALEVEAQKFMDLQIEGVRVQLEDVQESVAQQGRDAKEEVLAKIDDSVAEILAAFESEGGEEGEIVFRAEPGPDALARLKKEESRHAALEADLQVLREEHEELIRQKDERIAEQEAEIAQLRALLEEVTIGYERDKQETEALVNASNAHASALQQRLMNPPPVAPIPDATTILDSLPISLDEMVMAKLHPLMIEARNSTKNTLDAHSRNVQDKIVSTVIEGARVAHVLVNYLNAKDHAGLQAVLDAMASQDGQRNGTRQQLQPIQPPPPRQTQENHPPKPASASMQPPPRPVSSISVPRAMPPPGATQLPSAAPMTNGWPTSVAHQVPVPAPQHQYQQWAAQQNQGVAMGAPPSGQTPAHPHRANQTAYSQANFVQGHASLMERMQAVRRDMSTSASASPGPNTSSTNAPDANLNKSLSESLDVNMDVDSPAPASSTTSQSLPAIDSHTPHHESAASAPIPAPLALPPSTVEPPANAPPIASSSLASTALTVPLRSTERAILDSRPPQPQLISTQHSRSKSVSPPPSPPSAIQLQAGSSIQAHAPEGTPTPRPAPVSALTQAPPPATQPQPSSSQTLASTSKDSDTSDSTPADIRGLKERVERMSRKLTERPPTSQPASAPATVQTFAHAPQPARQPPPIDTAVPAVAAAYSARRASAGGRDFDQSRLFQEQQQQSPIASVSTEPERDRLRREVWPPAPNGERSERVRRSSGPDNRVPEQDRARRQSGPSDNRERGFQAFPDSAVQAAEVLPPLRLGNAGFVPDARRAGPADPGAPPRSAGLPPAPHLSSSRSREKSPEPARRREAGYRRRDAYSASPNWD